MGLAHLSYVHVDRAIGNFVSYRPLVSIIFTSYTTERLKDIFELLISIKNQTYRNIEIIFVAERSRTLYEKVEAYAEQKGIPDMKAIFNEGEQGASAARNLGIKNATGEIIAIVDDDVVLFPSWAEEITKTYNQDSFIIGVTGPCIPLWKNESMKWFPEEFHWIISCTTWIDLDKTSDVRNVWLENASFRREAFELGGLLDTRLGPQDSLMGFKGREIKEGVISEEVEFSLRITKKTAKRIVFNPQVKVWHKVYPYRLRLKYIVQWSYWAGLSKQMLKKSSKDFRDRGVISQEYSLLKRILTKLFPSTLKGFFRNPTTALRRFLVTVVILAFVAIGYISGFFRASTKA